MYLLQLLLLAFVSATQTLIVALALYLVFVATRAYNLALGAVGAAAAYATYAALTAGYGWALASLVAFAAASAIGLIVFVCLEPLNRRGRTHASLLASFAVGVLIEATIALVFGTDGKNMTPTILEALAFGGVSLPWSGILTLAIGAILFASVAALVLWTPQGRTLRSMAENPAVSASLGVDDKRLRLVAMLVAGLLSGTIGILIGLNTSLTPGMGFTPLVLAFIALLSGGGHLGGVIVAAFLITTLPELVIGFAPASWHLTQSWYMALAFLAAGLLLALRPRAFVKHHSRF